MLYAKRNLLSTALASAIALAAPQVFAQEDAPPATDDATDLDRVKVTGIRSAIEKSIDTKQTSTSIVEAISAEDIGKLPDSSIAESIARLPGLTAQRERGRATQINIRGLSGDFSTATLNGREQVSTGDNRGVEFDQYPSELLSSVVVYKTPDAGLVGQGLSGTVDLQTVRPLSYGERTMSVNARYDQNKIRGEKETGYRFSGTWIDQFADGRLGVMLAVAKMDSPQPSFQNESSSYANVPGRTDVQVLGTARLFRVDSNQERTGLAGTLQFKPNDVYEGTLDLLYSKFTKTEDKAGLEFSTVYAPAGWALDSYSVTGSTATTSSWRGLRPLVMMISNPIDDRLRSIGFNNKFRIGDQWLINADASVSNVKRDMRMLDSYAGLASGATTTVDISLDPSGRFYNYLFGARYDDPSNLVLTDPAGWRQDGYLKDFIVEDKLTAFRLNAVRSFDEGFISDIDFGANHSTRIKSRSADEYQLCLTNCLGGMNGASAPVPGSVRDFNFGGIDRLVVWDPNAVLASGTYNLLPRIRSGITTKNWEVDEDLTTAYVKFGINADVAGMPLRGNVGAQQIWVDQTSEGYGTFAGNAAGTPTSDGLSYSVFLPSLNLGLEFLPETFLRFAAGKQMARPRMDHMRANMDVVINRENQWEGTGGNPRLKPWLADALDVSLEKYFSTESGNRGYFGAAWFHKDLKTYIYNQTLGFDYAGFPLPDPIPGQTNYPTTTVGLLNQPANGEGGGIRGIELTASVPLDMLWKPLNGFGVIATYSDTSSSIKPYGPTGASEPIPGLSKYVSNTTLYYERGGFSVRYSRRTRSDFLGESRAVNGDLRVINIDGETIQDAQLNYAFNRGPLQGLSLYLQVSNIGDEPFSRYNAADPANRPASFLEYGRTTLLGFSYRF